MRLVIHGPYGQSIELSVCWRECCEVLNKQPTCRVGGDVLGAFLAVRMASESAESVGHVLRAERIRSGSSTRVLGEVTDNRLVHGPAGYCGSLSGVSSQSDGKVVRR